jgi:hypothetical protein
MIAGAKRKVDLARWSYSDERFNLTRGVILVLLPLLAFTILLAGLFGGPETREISLGDWAKAAPTDFLLTSAQELAEVPGKGSSGPPYNLLQQGEHLGPINLQKLGGLGIPIDPARDFVLGPLQESQDRNTFALIGESRSLDTEAQTKALEKFVQEQNAEIGAALSQWANADVGQQHSWARHYIAALEKTGDWQVLTDDPAFGPVKEIVHELLYLAQSGLLDGLLTTGYSPYPSDFTLPALFLGDGKYFKNLTVAEHFNGNRMAISGGTNSYPGQFWLRPIAFLYSIKPFSTSKNADVQVFFMMLITSMAFILLPKIPILNKLPRLLPFHRVRLKIKK